MSVARPGLFGLHLVPVDRAVIFISIEAGPLVIENTIDPERICDLGIRLSFALILIQTLKD